MGKISIKGIFLNYYDTLHKNGKRETSKQDVVIHLVFPFAFSAFCTILLSKLNILESLRASFSDAIMALTIVSTLLCALAIMLFQLRMSLKDTFTEQGETKIVDQEILLIDEMFSDVLWAVVAGFISVIFMVLAGFDLPSYLVYLFVGCALVFVSNFAIVTCMCLKRLSAAYTIVSKVWTKKK